MDITPDLSHLTDGEKKIIQAVIHRQRAQEKRESFEIRTPDGDYSSPPIAISSRPYFQSNQSGGVCQICQNTKFANEESSRQCSTCNKRFCVHCGIRLKPQYYLCNPCRQKQEHYFSSTNNISKQYLSDYILSQNVDENQMNQHGANRKYISPKLKISNDDDDISSPESMFKCDNKNRLLPEMKKDKRSMNILRDFQYHSLEDRESGQESTLKDSGIDTASSSTILNVISSDQFKKPITYWCFSETRTEQIGYIYLKNNLATYDYDQKQRNKQDLLNALGLKIQSGVRYENEYITEIIKVIRGSVADNYGQLQAGDHILEWNGEKLSNLSPQDVNRIILQHSMQSPQIHMIVKRLIRHSALSNNDPLLANRTAREDQTISSTIENSGIQLQLSFQYDQKHLHVMIYGAKNISLQQGLFACQLSLQYGRDILSKEEKCTKAQSCSSGICIWNQRIIFFDIEPIDNILLCVKLINLEHNQDILGEIKLYRLNLNNKCEWFSLNEASTGLLLDRTSSPTAGIPSAANNRKRQLPDIPLERLQVNTEKVSQELLQKVVQIKLGLHAQPKVDIASIKQHSFDHVDSIQREISNERSSPIDTSSRKSMTNLSNLSSTSKTSLTTKIKDKSRIPIIRDRSAPNPTTLTRRVTIVGEDGVNTEKSRLKPLEDRYRRAITKRYSMEAPGDDIDSDGSELSSASKLSSTSMLSAKSERPGIIRKTRLQANVKDQFHGNEEVQLREEELRQLAMSTYETRTNLDTTNKATIIKTNTVVPPSAIVPDEKTVRIDQRNDGTVSDSALSSQSELIKKQRPSMSSKAFVILGLSKKANSSSSLGSKRYGFQRSEEIGVQPHLRSRAMQQQLSKENKTPSSAPPSDISRSPFNRNLQRDQYHSMPHNIELWSGALKLPHEHQFADFIEGLGTGQLVGRQVLASPCHGEIQIGLRDHQGLLEIEIVRARNLLQKALYRTPPAPYVKVYLLDGKTCIEKQRTRTTRRTLDPLIQQTLMFKENFREKVLQISVLGDYSKLDRKVFMGVCQIGLKEIKLNSSQQILDWYKLFSANSLMNSYMIVQQSKRKASLT
ncbi:unnamed protein product [Rotaria magnacalcarata]|uniref:Uncharacterized protein n=1 Tax=Rotaria magnacalcarata TaxID=392030 RepID=A0A815YT52_9BILA|nr:unnamed protein product [Rotaria magnacalcarata]CAF1575878.1 unnamed protein product [Rotaria magnacalcarata]CAF2152108.1 unnamed protein product [Rotaria magnacalcarata]